MNLCDKIQQKEQELHRLYSQLDRAECELEILKDPTDLSNMLPTQTYLSGIRLQFNPITQQVILKNNDYSILYLWAEWYEPTLGEIEDKVRELGI